MADQGHETGAPRVPKADRLVPGARGHKLGRAAGRWGLLQPRHWCEVLVRRGGGQGAALDVVLVADHGLFSFSIGSDRDIPLLGAHVVAGRQEVAAVERGEYIPDPAGMALERPHAEPRA